MKIISAILCFLFLATVSVSSEPLPLLKVRGWTPYHVVSKGSHHVLGVSADGSINFYFLKRGSKLNSAWPVEMKIRIERRAVSKGAKSKPSKWVRKSVKRDRFVSPPEPKENPEELQLIGTVTGGVKFQLNFKFTKSGVMLTGKVLGDPKDAEYRISVRSEIDKLSTVTSTEANDIKLVKAKTKRSELKIETRKAKTLKVKFYEVLDIAALDKAEVISVELKTSKIGRKKLTWSLANEKLGKLNIECKAKNGMAYAGFDVSSILYDASGQHLSDGILLEYK